MILKDYEKIVYEEWFLSLKIRAEIKLYENEFIVMPNHIYGIFWIIELADRVGVGNLVGSTRPLIRLRPVTLNQLTRSVATI